MKSTDCAEIEDIPLELLREPLDWFFAEHYRHRQLCQMIDEVAASSVHDAQRLAKIVDFLRFDLPLHIIDEEEDLFPLLRRRALPGDDLEQVLGVLSAEHKADVDQARCVRTLLETCLEERSAPGLDPAKQKTLNTFASQERHHLAMENAVILPIARLRLSVEDLNAMSRRLAARRGQYIEDAPE